MKSTVLIGLVLLSISITACKGLDLGIEYTKTPMVKYQKGEVSTYDMSLGIDFGAFYISANKDVCEGFDSTKDFCFPPAATVYYEMIKDTLNLYSTYLPPNPIHFPLPFKMHEISVGLDSLDKRYKEGTIRKIEFDTIFYAVPCSRIPYTTRNNMKFKKS